MGFINSLVKLLLQNLNCPLAIQAVIDLIHSKSPEFLKDSWNQVSCTEQYYLNTAHRLNPIIMLLDDWDLDLMESHTFLIAEHKKTTDRALIYKLIGELLFKI